MMNAYLAELMALLNWFDWLMVVVISVSLLYGLFRGLIKEAVTITAWALAAWLSYVYAEELSQYLEPHIQTASMRVALIILSVFVVVLSLSAVARQVIRFIVDRVGLIGLDYVLGGIFGALRGVVLAMLLMIVLLNLGFSQDQWWRDSYLVNVLSDVMRLLPEHLPKEVQDMYKRIALVDVDYQPTIDLKQADLL